MLRIMSIFIRITYQELKPISNKYEEERVRILCPCIVSWIELK